MNLSRLCPRKIDLFLFIFLAVLICVFRLIVLQKFGFEYTDGDQTVMWCGLVDYNSGTFHEPRFYGQNYNTMLEALFAIPLYRMGIPVYKALPIVTSIMAIFPFILIAYFTFKQKATFTSLLILSIPLLLPIEYSLITTLPRGFITGVFFSSIGAISIFSPKKTSSFILASFFCVMSFSVNANSILIGIPVIFYLFLTNKKNPKFYIYTTVTLLISTLIHIGINNFYILNPNYNLHNHELSFNFDLLIDSFSNLDRHFTYVTPLLWGQGFLLLLILLISGIIVIWKMNINLGLFILSIPILIISTLGFNKVHDGSGSIYLSLSRMYLALPILIVLCVSFLKINWSNIKYSILLLPLVYFVFKISQLNSSITENIAFDKKEQGAIRVVPMDYLKIKCHEINKICTQYNVQLLIIGEHIDDDIINYGCSSCEENFPNTLRPDYERRTWELLNEENKIYANILVLDTTSRLNEFKTLKNKELNLITENTLTTLEVINKLNIGCREFKLKANAQ